MESKRGVTLVSNIFFWLGAIIIVIGVSFKILHLENANTILYFGLAIGCLWMLIEWIKTKKSDKDETI